MTQLLNLGVVPIINENDAVGFNKGDENSESAFTDNDSLASLLAVQMGADVCLLLTDVDGVFDKPPGSDGAKKIDVFMQDTDFVAGSKSERGRGGIDAKVAAALSAIDGGVKSVVIASGFRKNVIQDIFSGKPIGTLFLQSQSSSAVANSPSSADPTLSMVEVAAAARHAGLLLQSLPASTRTAALLAMADAIAARSHEILAANALDMESSQKDGLSLQLMQRLELTEAKVADIVKMIRAAAQHDDPVGKCMSTLEVADGLVLRQLQAPIGVVMIIFESRPDCLPQIASLAVRSGNAVILKGGKEADRTCRLLADIIRHAIESTPVSPGSPSLPPSVITLVSSRDDVSQLLSMHQHIDLVIPRGSAALVKHVSENTKIPVMGHSEGICHVYLDEHADAEVAVRVAVDSKINSPSACNAAETLLLHEAILAQGGVADVVLRALRAAGVQLYGGPQALKLGLVDHAASGMNVEYGDLRMSVEVVNSAAEAIAHINQHGSHHTDCIVTQSRDHALLFTQGVDSACTFVNASTRFADGFRFGLGAEVGVSTSRLHARGPVGIQGLMSMKWVLTSSSASGHIVEDFGGAQPLCSYTHKRLPL